ncbi:MAG: DUF3365 domain-containing protein [Nitrospirae bacterium]|nr:DUF3365 domain-containing protein [Nitrospirota bacterium]
MSGGKESFPVLRQYPVALLAAWSVLVLISIAFNIYQSHQETLEKARIEARTYFELNLYYRKYIAGLGGVYAPVDKVEPNPFLDVPERDVTTTDGKKLTLMNPAYMTRQVFEIIRKYSELPVLNKLTSLKNVNPANYPDAWEKKALLGFERGEKEASVVINMNGRPYLRLAMPFVTEEACLKCHEHQGYSIGDIRGGISMAVPLEPYFASEANTRRTIILSHMLLWFLVSAAIVVFTRKSMTQQRQLAESEWKFRTLSEYSADWEFWVTGDNAILFMTPSCSDITGYAPEEFNENPRLMTDIIHLDDRALWQKHLDDFTLPLHDEMEFRIITKEGEVKWLSHICRPIFKENVFLGRRVSNRDITDRKKLEAQLLQAQKMEAVGHLAGGIAHDFNNILTAIIGYCNLLQMKMEKGSPLKNYIDQILSTAEKASSLTHQILIFSRKQVINPRPVNLGEIVRDVEKLLTRLIGEDIELKTEVSGDDLVVMADRGQIDQVLMNLATNARDAMPGGGLLSISTEKVHIDADYVRVHGYGIPGSYGVISVSDSGTGMDQETRKRIFEPFFTTKNSGKGTGLGLSMVYGIVKQHNGYINVYSEQGNGTIFRTYLPLTDERLEPALMKMPHQQYGGTETILLAEDNEEVRSLIRHVLEESGYKVIEAVDGEDAAAVFQKYRSEIKLLIFDVIMPRKSGIDAYEEISATSPGTDVLFMSGYTADVLLNKGILKEGLNFILKPASPVELLQKVGELLEKSRKLKGAGHAA